MTKARDPSGGKGVELPRPAPRRPSSVVRDRSVCRTTATAGTANARANGMAPAIPAIATTTTVPAAAATATVVTPMLSPARNSGR